MIMQCAKIVKKGRKSKKKKKDRQKGEKKSYRVVH